MLKYFLILLSLTAPLISQGAFFDVTINEIAWMGTISSANDEWIELYNNTSSVINLDDWVLKASDGTPEIKLVGGIPANGFFLLERTDDTTVPDVAADLIYKGALGNNGEDLKLFDSSGNLIDETNFSDSWPAGDNTTKQTMERIASAWQTSQSPGGTPKNGNSSGSQASPSTPVPVLTTPSPLLTPQVIPEETYPAGVVFNEILPSPEGSDTTEEWIEIYNQNGFEIDLSDWKIEDTTGKTTPYLFPAGTKIPQNGFLVLKRPETKITLNNDGDGLNLFSPSKEKKDAVSYEKAPLGQSYNLTSKGWTWSSKLTPGALNIISTKETKQVTPKPSPNDETFVIDLSSEKETAAVAAAATNIPRKWFPFLIAIPLAVVSAGLILSLKKSLL